MMAKSQKGIKVLTNHPEKDLNICTESHGNPSNIAQYLIFKSEAGVLDIFQNQHKRKSDSQKLNNLLNVLIPLMFISRKIK